MEQARKFLSLLDPGAPAFTFMMLRNGRAANVQLPLPSEAWVDGDVYVTINDVDVVRGADGRKQWRRAKNAVRVRAVWQEDDDGFKGEFPIPPSMVVQSSNGRFHRYWLVDGDWPADKDGRADFANVMARMVASYGCDNGAKDIVRVLRVPGFGNQKRGGIVQILDANGQRYTRAEILAAFPPVVDAAPSPSHTQLAIAAPAEVNPAYVQRAVDAELDKVRSTPEGGRNIQLNNSACAIGNMVGAGWISEGEAKAGLLQAALGAGLKQRASLATIRSGLERGKLEPRQPPDNPHAEQEARGAALVSGLAATKKSAPNHARTDNGDVIDATTGEIVQEAQEASEHQSEGLPEHLTQVPGLVGDITDWIEATARYPSRIMAIAAALTIVGTAIGREMAGPTKSATHLYVLVLAPTGSGKQHPLDQAGRLMNEAGMHGQIGPSDFKSGPAVTATICVQPLLLCRMDEFGALMRRINAHGANEYARDITKMLRTLWGLSFAPYTSDAGAKQAAQTIHAPALSVLAASTEHEFYSAVGEKEVLDGFLNRFLFLVEPHKRPEQDPAIDPLDVPKDLAARLSYLFKRPQEGKNISSKTLTTAVKPRGVPWGKGAKAIYDGMSGDIEAVSEEMAPYYARSKEMAVRLATIIACGIDPDKPAISTDAMMWARDVALYSARTMAMGVEAHTAETKTQGIAKEIVRIIGKSKGRTIGQRELGERLRKKYSKRERDEVIAMLLEDGAICRFQVEFGKGTKGGRPGWIYGIPSKVEDRMHVLKCSMPE